MIKKIFIGFILLYIFNYSVAASHQAHPKRKVRHHKTYRTVKKYRVYRVSKRHRPAATLRTSPVAALPILTTPSAIPLDKLNQIAIAHQPHLYSYAALAMDADSGEILVTKNPNAKLPIASITKLMTAMVVLDADIDLNEDITITRDDIDTLRRTSSRLRVGMQLRRKDLLLLALMSSENRAAFALARTTFPGGIKTFIRAMNSKALELKMPHTRFYDPTGLTMSNQSTAEDLSRMVKAAFEYNLVREYTTTKGADVMLGRNYTHHYINSDALVRANKFQIAVSKTGFINEAGHCLVLYSIVNDRPVIMVFLNSAGKSGRLVDAIVVKNYIQRLG